MKRSFVSARTEVHVADQRREVHHEEMPRQRSPRRRVKSCARVGHHRDPFPQVDAVEVGAEDDAAQVRVHERSARFGEGCRATPRADQPDALGAARLRSSNGHRVRPSGVGCRSRSAMRTSHRQSPPLSGQVEQDRRAVLCCGGFTHVFGARRSRNFERRSNPDSRRDLPHRNHVEVGSVRWRANHSSASRRRTRCDRSPFALNHRASSCAGLVGRVRIRPRASRRMVASMQRRRARFTPGSLRNWALGSKFVGERFGRRLNWKAVARSTRAALPPFGKAFTPPPRLRPRLRTFEPAWERFHRP